MDFVEGLETLTLIEKYVGMGRRVDGTWVLSLPKRQVYAAFECASPESAVSSATGIDDIDAPQGILPQMLREGMNFQHGTIPNSSNRTYRKKGIFVVKSPHHWKRHMGKTLKEALDSAAIDYKHMNPFYATTGHAR